MNLKLFTAFILTSIGGGIFLAAMLQGLPTNVASSLIIRAVICVAAGPLTALVLGFSYSFDTIVWVFISTGTLGGVLIFFVRESSWKTALRVFGLVSWLGTGFISCLALIKSGI